MLELRLTGIRDVVEGILSEVRGPARYTGGEIGEIKKDHSKVDVLFALAFPDVYEVGMSNLGLKILYHTLNRRDDTAAERVFAPAADMEDELRKAHLPLYALESFVPVRDFDILGFSLAYELTYTNVLNMLDLAQIPLRTVERKDSHPLVIAGGHCTVNPEPMADFIDAFVLGDGEEIVHRIVDLYKACKGDRPKLLAELARVDGVYVPSIGNKARRTAVADFENADFPSSMVIPFTETVHDRAALEIMRGCTRTCRFCQAGMITRPVRERSTAKLKEQVETLISNTGYDEIGLMSLSSADYTHIEKLVHDLIGKYEPERIGVSLPSIRADAGTVRFAAEIQKVRKSGLTFAPEAGTQRLRDVINKNVTEADLLEAVETAVRCGWRKIKLYFMIGLPTETDEDVSAIGDLVYKVLGVAKFCHKPLSINVGVSSFVPKPHTPFQWRPQNSIEELERKIDILKSRLRGRNISFSWHDTTMSELEAVMARGGRELGKAIELAWQKGSKFDGWDDRFDYNRWQQVFSETGIDADAIAHGQIKHETPLPWDHIDCGVSKSWLISQDELADTEETVPDCRFGKCTGCGSDSIAKCGLVNNQSEATEPIRDPQSDIPNPERVFYRLMFAKNRELRWLGHLDLVRVFERAIRRARLPIAYSEGFNPRPRMSFYTQLPVGITGEAEPMTIELKERMDPAQLMDMMNAALPAGLRIRSAQETDGRRSPEINGSEYLIGVVGTCDGELPNAIRALLESESIVVERKKERESKEVDIRPGIEKIEILDANGDDACTGLIRARVNGVKPSEIVDAMRTSATDVRMKFAHRIGVY